MSPSSISRLVAVVASLLAITLSHAFTKQTGKIGIFDLDAIHKVPLDPEIVARKVDGGVVTEAVRVTSVPGVRVLIILTYGLGLKGKPGTIFARRYGAEARLAEAKSGFVGVSVAPPTGNEDPNRFDTVGGPKIDYQIGFRQFFQEDVDRSPLYHHVVALTRVVDYLATRPEIDLKKTSVIGSEWPGMAVALLHAIDDRPAAYFVWHGAGFYTDPEGRSGTMRGRVTRKAYEMYCPAAYASYGTRPFYLANGTNGDESRFDAIIELARGLKSPKVLAIAPNRERSDTSAKEFSGSGAWQAYFTSPTGTVPTISEGEVSVVEGKLRYSCSATGQSGASLLVSYGDQGDWTGKNWDRLVLKRVGDKLVADIPVYEPSVPIHAFAQIQTATFGSMANIPLLISPSGLGLKAATSTYGNELLGSNDLYVATGSMSIGSDKSTALVVKLNPSWDGMVRMKHFDPSLWKGSTSLSITVRADASLSTLNLYFATDSRNEVDADLQNYSKFTLLKTGETLGQTWRTFTVPLNQVTNLPIVDSLFIETAGKPLQLASIAWR